MNGIIDDSNKCHSITWMQKYGRDTQACRQPLQHAVSTQLTTPRRGAITASLCLLSTPPHKRGVEITAHRTTPSAFDPLFAVRSTEVYST